MKKFKLSENMWIYKRNIPIWFKILNWLVGLVFVIYFYWRFSSKQYEMNDETIEYAVSMTYDFKIVSSQENSFYCFTGKTIEGKLVNYQIPKFWDLDGVCSIGDSVYKEAGDSCLFIVKPDKRIKIMMKKKSL